MPGPGLETNIDATYADDGTDGSVKRHQQLHDIYDAFLNEFDTATRQQFEVWAHDGSIFQPTLLDSRYLPQTFIEAAPAGTAYTFVAADAGKLKRSNATDTAAATWTIPPNAAVPLPINTSIGILQFGTGQITVVGGAGVTLRAFSGATALAGIYADAVITKVFTDTWWIRGRTV
jgi:hypothetical protein